MTNSPQVGQECFYFGSAHFGRMTHAVEKDVALDPVDVGLLGADRVMLEADGVANLIQKFFGVLFRRRPFPPDLTTKRSWLYTVGVVGSVS